MTSGRDRQRILLERMAARGVREAEVYPGPWRLLRALGMPLDPSAFQPREVVALIYGVPGALLGARSWLEFLRR